MTVSVQDRTTIREAARRVAEIAADPHQARTADLWRRLNNLERVRPMILLQDGTCHETGWKVTGLLTTEGEFAREQERELRQRIADEIMYQLAALLPPAYRGVYSDLEVATEDYLEFDPPATSNLPQAEG